MQQLSFLKTTNESKVPYEGPSMSNVFHIVPSDFSSGRGGVRDYSFSQEPKTLTSPSMLMSALALGKFITQPQVTIAWWSDQPALPQFQHCSPCFSLLILPTTISDFSISQFHNPFSSPISRFSWKWKANFSSKLQAQRLAHYLQLPFLQSDKACEL